MNKYQEALKLAYEMMNAADFGSAKIGCTALKTLQELVDKATPKKPLERLFERNKHLKVCPSCWEKDIKTFVCGKYCDECGQRLE